MGEGTDFTPKASRQVQYKMPRSRVSVPALQPPAGCSSSRGIDTEIENLDNRRSPPQQIRQHADENCVLMLAADASQHHDHRHRNGTVLDVRCQMLLRAFSPGGAFASELIDPSIHPSAQRTFPQHDSSSRACATRRRDERHSLLRPGDFSSPQNRDRKLQWLCFDCRPADLRCASCVSACPSDFGTGSRPRRASALDLRIPLESSISVVPRALECSTDPRSEARRPSDRATPAALTLSSRRRWWIMLMLMWQASSALPVTPAKTDTERRLCGRQCSMR
ncbi:hypothetical protein AXG93_3911s1650 [Marchantia polymorpha subsp. ruderalis]|uniref:Uncharacterized protein n=1 Tax=Marchantia polymorpha subsp. ruderalis TaxID=1480154 RepID=A0A176W4L9_MARPO|nr:hypothetical protein AXG93_3911s1650 [Marchantia polymorpha subsp. ruderalis]